MNRGDPPILFAPDGRRLAIAVTGGIQVWDTSRGTELLTIRGLGWVQDLAFSLDGTRLIALLSTLRNDPRELCRQLPGPGLGGVQR